MRDGEKEESQKGEARRLHRLSRAPFELKGRWCQLPLRGKSEKSELFRPGAGAKGEDKGRGEE
jgi:hypothetical protein